MQRKAKGALALVLLAGAALGTASLTTAGWNRPAGPDARMAHGMVIAVDPETGQLGPAPAAALGRPMTIEEAQAWARDVAATLVTETHPDGSQSLIHDDRLADYALIRMTPEGHPVVTCVEGAAAAANTLRQPVRDASGLEVE